MLPLIARPRRRRAGSLADQLATAAGGSANVAGLWLYGVNATVGGGTLSAWQDARGGAFPTLVQATGSRQPADSGSDYVFDGVDDYIQCSYTLAQPSTLIVVVKEITPPVGVFARITGAPTATTSVLYQSPGDPILVTQYAGANGPATTDLATNTYGIFTAIYNGASSTLRVNENTAATGNPSTNAANGLSLGADGSGGVPSNTAFKAAMTCKSALTAGQASAVRTLLYTAYGVTP